ncbi:MAG TPA: histidine kinase [Virgibacillus sp.]|nr:histidine kinase [Virgibacillus sp.]
MTYKQLKWLILLVPTITVGVWEYVRHEYLLPYISMDTGNWLTPVIVLFVTFTLLTRFFTKMETIQEQLRIERSEKAVLKEREQIAHGLHDGVAQSLFLLSIKVNQLEKLTVSVEDKDKLEELNKSISDIHQYVRASIENLRERPHQDLPFLHLINDHIKTFEKEAKLTIEQSIKADENLLSAEEKFELASCIHEGLINIHKHAQATIVILKVIVTTDDCYILIQDNGIGFDLKDVYKKDHYGLQMMYERCKKINWELDINRSNGQTILLFTPK